MMASKQDLTLGARIVDLPLDILRHIFSFFEPSDGRKNGKANLHNLNSFLDSGDYHTIKNARLTCWALNVAASPLLCPILRISLEQESLERAENICSNGLINAGIRGVQIHLSYRPPETANSLERYKTCRLRELAKIYDTYAPHERELYGSFRSLGVGEESDTLHFLPLRDAWNAMSNTKHILSNDDILYQNLLQDAYKSYQRHHEEQVQLVAEKTFVSRVATLIAGIEHPLSLSLLSYSPRASRRGSVASHMPLASRSNFQRFMDAPHDWDTIEKLVRGPSGFSVSKLLIDLPIACHRAGAAPRHIYVDCSPLSGYSMGSMHGEHPDWEGLEAASQMIQTFHFGPTICADSHTPRPFRSTLDQDYVDKLLGAISSSPIIDDYSLNLYSFGLRCGGWTKQGVMTFNYNIDAVVSRLRSKKLSSLKLGYVSMEESNLECLCESLAEEPESIELSTVRFTKGNNWQSILDGLSFKLACGITSGTCICNFSNLS